MTWVMAAAIVAIPAVDAWCRELVEQEVRVAIAPDGIDDRRVCGW